MLKLEITKSSEKPAYIQIVEQVILAVRGGELKIGDKLPSERELAKELGLARGTVKKAYERLAADHVIEMARGCGSFISPEQDVLEVGRKEQAVRKINRLIAEMEKLHFSSRETGSLFQVLLAERQRSRMTFHVAAVDCNPEALMVFERQLQHVSNIKVHKILLDDVLKNPAAQRSLHEYDLILTTSTHNSQLRSLLAGCRERILPAVLSPSRQTIIDLAQLSTQSRVGILCQSVNFLNIIKSHLRYFQVKSSTVKAVLDPEPAKLRELLAKVNVLIVPPKCETLLCRELESDFRDFAARGGRIVHFDYQIERGALTYIEEKISGVMQEKRSAYHE
jgi:DNA-binding transcriptional regulator YhcF (GntR family)